MDINISSQLVVQTAAQWAADTTVYSAKRILITSDATYTGTDQRKFKIANGVDTWANLDYFPDVNAAIAALSTVYQPLDSDLTAIAGLTPANDDIIQRKSGSWTNRTMAQLIADLAALGTTFQPLDADLTSWSGVTRASGFDTFAATPSSANLRSLLTDETGTGAAYFQGGALGTPSSGTLTNCTGLPIAGVTGYQGYSLNGGIAAAVNPADSTNYYIGSYRTTLSAVDGAARIIFPKAGTIKTIYTFVRVAGTLGSNEAVAFSFRLNSTTNTSLGNQTWDAVSVVGTYTGLSISVAAGDFGELLIAAPAWATNPTTVTIYFAFYLE